MHDPGTPATSVSVPKSPLLIRSSDVITPDKSRVVARPFIPGFTGTLDAMGGSRVDEIVRRVLDLSDDEVAGALDRNRQFFSDRHHDLEASWEEHFRLAIPHSELLQNLAGARRLLLGAVLTQEYAFEGAALCNPSLVEFPGLDGDGVLRIVMSARAIGEGHISSIEFRTGSINGHSGLTIDRAPRLVRVGRRTSVTYFKPAFVAKLRELGADPSIVEQVCGPLDPRFTFDDLEATLPSLEIDSPHRAAAFETVRLVHWLASSNYRIEFDPGDISERLIFPAGPADSHGMEDARFVRFHDDGGSTTYYATYTAYDGYQILPQLIETPDFERFDITTISGSKAQNKGMALFPVRIDGRYAAISRYDRESLYIMSTDDVRVWNDAELIYRPTMAWEVVQIGNCGSPLETPDGWLVLTHGVGPMRRYVLGAILLDKTDPSRVIGRLAQPLLEPLGKERDGYVPNVVYSCGGLIHDGRLVLAYGFGDHSIGFGTVPVSDLIGAMV